MACRRFIAPAVTALVAGALIGLALSGSRISKAAQHPTISFDMITSGNSYDAATNTMTVGSVEDCLTSAAPGNNLAHNHNAHIVVQNVEDLIGWQARVNYLGEQFRPFAVNFTPFADTSTSQNISFVNLPIEQGVGIHRDVTAAAVIPPAASRPQTAAFGSAYLGHQGSAVSPDTPAKRAPDDTSYSAPSGGVLASLLLQVPAGNVGKPSLFLNLDDANPQAPGSGFSFFDGTESQAIDLPVQSLGDAYHGEGTTCVPLNCVVHECPPDAPSPTAQPSPTPPSTPPPPRHPRVSLDMDPSENTYADSTNTMTVGSIQNCLTSTTANQSTHIHTAHLVITDVNDLVGWQVNMNYLGDQMRPNSVNFTPFFDNNTGQGISFVNLPLEAGAHRAISTASSLPAGESGPQTAQFASSYIGPQSFAISPDTPPKSTPDDTSYSASTGGVLASVALQVVGNQSAQSSLFMNLDDDPLDYASTRSNLAIFDGTGYQVMDLETYALGDGYHGEGANCAALDCVTHECPDTQATPTITPTSPDGTPTPTPTVTPTPAGHDSGLARMSGVPKSVRLSPGEVIADSGNITVVNQSGHSDIIGVYVDVAAPASGGCSPNGRVLQTTVTLAAGAKTTIPVPVSYSCSDPAAANGQSFTWIAVADHNGDDIGSCPPGSLQGVTCFNALADDDQDPADNRLSRGGPKVIAQ